MHLSTVDLNLLVVLQAVLDTQSVKLAAARLALSPSATSHALGRLRDLLGDPILVRAGRSLVRTPRGERLRPQLARLLEDIENLLAGDSDVDPSKLRRAFNIATTDYGERVLLTPLGQRLHRLAPGVDLYSARQAMFESDIRSDACDLGIGVVDSPPADILAEALFEERFVCLLRKRHRASARRLTLARYAALDHILVVLRGTPSGVVDRMLAAHGLQRRVARTVSTFAVAPRLVCKSDYVLTIPERLGRPMASELGLVVREAPAPIGGFTMRMAWHRRTNDDPAHRWLRTEIRTLSASLT